MELTPEDQAVLDAAEAWFDWYESGETNGGAQRNLHLAVFARRKAREPKRCKHCGERIVLTASSWWHTRSDSDEYGVSNTAWQQCKFYAEPDDSPAVEAR